ncbi:hypothetical protein AN958_05625 [Leucoagaricus sp. SymC.cos]|nr:hypothetical protein AN958_05625 [Leucoagaricus sp. SymC.cos]
MDDESSDILGQQTKPVLRGVKNVGSPGISLTVKLVFGFAVLLVLYVVIMRIWFRILVWKERSYKLAMRRRHGIPDNDHRPFNVAYATVVRARQEQEAAQRKATQPVLSSDRRNAQTEQNVRQRFGVQATSEAPRASSYSSRLPGAYFTEGTPARYHTESSLPSPVNVGTRRYPSQPRQASTRLYDNGAPSYLNGPRRSSRRGLGVENENSGQKRGFVEDPDEQEVAKRSKRDDWERGGELGATAWQDQVRPQRGAKRYLLDEDENEDDLVERQPRDKRARKVSVDKGTQAEEDDDLDMDVDEEADDVDDLPHIQRGKKRDRAEAGSTFGADDDDSGIELDSPESKHKRRTRKRRTFSKRKSDVGVATRGQKRDRDLDNEATNMESGDENSYVLRKKRGKQSTLVDDESSEHSTTRSQTSSGIRNRRIGEEWISNGIRWKVGPNGQRLRQALVKKAGQRFPMPEDSQHPDREVDFEVYVESWLSDEEYRDAKQRHLLAGQDTLQRSVGRLTLDVQTQVSGKNLLWSSTSTPIESPVSRSPISERAHGTNQRITRTSLVSSSSPRTNPFEEAPTHTVRRISSISRATSTGAAGSAGLADSTNSSPHTRYKTYSKLEKQELEAQALMKLRELKSKKEVESNQTEDEQATKQKENVDSAKIGSTPFTVPTITVTTPSDASEPATQATPLFNLSKPAEDASKPAEVSKPSPLFPFPSSADSAKPTEAPKPTTVFPPAVASASKADDKTAAPAATAPPSFFSLTTPSTQALPTSTQNHLSKPLFNLSGTTTTSSDNKPEQSAKLPSFFPSNTTTAFSANTTSTMPQSSASTNPLLSLGGQKAPETSTSGSLLSRLGPPQSSTSTTTTSTSPQPASQPASFFNLSKPNTTTATATTTPNPFSTTASQTTTQTTSSDPSAAASDPPKFDFKFTGPTSTSTATSSNNPTANVNPAAASTAPSSNPFEGKAPYRPMATFTPLTPDGGTKPVAAVASAPKTDTTLFGFKAPTSGANGDASKPPVSVFGVTGGAPNPFTTGSSNTAATVFGSPSPFGAKPAENKPTDSSGSQPAKPLFKFNLAPSQTSSSTPKDSTSQPGASSVFGAPVAAATHPTSNNSSLFGALGPQQTNVFGTTSTLGATSTSGSSNIFGTKNTSPSNTSAPANVFGSQAPASIFGSQSVSTSSGNQPANIFGNSRTGTSNAFGATANKPAEAPKSVFGVTFAPTTDGTTSNTSEQPKPSFRFQLPTSNNGTTGPSGMTNVAASTSSSSSSGPEFTFKFGASSGPSQTPVFRAQPGPKPSVFGAGDTFGSTGGSSGFNPLGAASQGEQK